MQLRNPHVKILRLENVGATAGGLDPCNCVSLGQIRVKLKREKDMWVKLCIIKRGGGEVGGWGQCQPYFLSLIEAKHS